MNQDGRSKRSHGAERSVTTGGHPSSLSNAGVKPAEVELCRDPWYRHGSGRSYRSSGFGRGARRKPPGREAADDRFDQNQHWSSREPPPGSLALMKVVVALQHEEIPPHLHFKEPNPYIPWKELPVRVPDGVHAVARQEERRRIAGVSSFGFSGTNAHVVIEEAPKKNPAGAAGETDFPSRPLSAAAFGQNGAGAQRTGAALRKIFGGSPRGGDGGRLLHGEHRARALRASYGAGRRER